MNQGLDKTLKTENIASGMPLPSSSDDRPSFAVRNDESLLSALAQREAVLLAPYAMHSVDSKGRQFREPPHPYRGPYQRDRDRIIHCAAFRRLSSKTQVFTGEMGDYHRTRLTHTLEVTSLARTLGRALRLNEDLIEALALLHDIGHPPFGHTGEETLDRCLASEGGFSHNAQALRIAQFLEQRYPDFPGLNLSEEVLEGQWFRANKAMPGDSPLLEVQVVDAADSLSYDTHDADDALHLGLLTLDELAEQPLWREALQRVHRRWANLRGDELKRVVIHELIDWQVSQLLVRAASMLESGQIASTEAVRRHPPIVQLRSDLAEQKSLFERFLFDRVYRHPQVVALRQEAQDWLEQLFARYAADPGLLPRSFRQRSRLDGIRRLTADYLAGMTDRYARQQHLRLVGSCDRAVL